MRSTIIVSNEKIIDAFFEETRHGINKKLVVLVKGSNEFQNLRSFNQSELNIEIGEIIGMTATEARALILRKELDMECVR